jgi:hemerythrin
MDFEIAAWSEDLETGSPTIDEQHKQLMAALNELYDAHRHDKGREEVERTMSFLVEYTVKHFNYEEYLQNKHQYPEFEAHKQLHTEFKEVALALAGELRTEGPSDAMIKRVCLVVGNWVLNHIKGEDFKMAAHLRERLAKHDPQ